MERNDTIAAIATASGRAGVAIVRISGDDAWKIAHLLTGAELVEANRAELRAIRDAAGLLLDHALVLGFRAPKSYTGEDVVEFQCHGGMVTPQRVLEASLVAGARLARRGEFTERAFIAGKLNYDQAASVLDLVHARTSRAADRALEGLAGRRERELRALYDQALELSSRLEHALDVDDGELTAEFMPDIRVRLADLDTALAKAVSQLREGRLLREGALVVLAGAPNAGKSSLLNALLREQRAIVSEIPGTTRDSIEVWLDLAGYPIRLVDTAGLRETKDSIEAEGVRRSESLIATADIVLELSPNAAVSEDPRVITLHPKSDLSRGEGLNVSAKTGEGLEELKSAIVKRLEAQMDESVVGDGESDETMLATLLASRATLASSVEDIVLLANRVRAVAERLGAELGATYSEDLLDRLFSRFCVGK